MSLNPLGSEEYPSSPEEEKEKKYAEKIIAGLNKINPKIRKKSRSVSEQEQLYKVVTNVLAEWLDCFLIVGYNTSGQEFIMMRSESSMQKQAISGLLDQFTAEYFSNSETSDDE